VRKRTCTELKYLGVELDDKINAATRGKETDISAGNSTVKSFVIPTNEELVIARDTLQIVENL